MPAEKRDFPSFSWSISRHRKLKDCEREYYYQYYASHNGWCTDADELARQSYILKHLTTLPIALGQAVHERAVEIATAIRDGEPVPELDELYRRSAAWMNTVYSSQDCARFERRPKALPMLQERYHHRPISNDRLLLLRAKLERCTSALREAALWGEVSHCAPDEIHLPQSTDSIMSEGIPVYGAPDLVYRTEDRWTFVDWKTGQCDDVEIQLAVAGRYLCERYGFTPPVNGRAVFLNEGEELQLEVGDAEIARARDYIRESQWAMRRLLHEQDAVVNAPLPASAFRPRPDVSACAYCRFMSICDAEGQAGPF